MAELRAGSVVIGSLDGGDWSASFGLSLVDLLLVDASSTQRIVPHGMHLRSFCSTGGIAAGRNRLAADFLDRTGGEWLFMIDSDMGFGPDTVERLIASSERNETPVVGGLCFAIKREGRRANYATTYRICPTVYEFAELDDEVGFLPVVDYPRAEMVKVAATGAACLLIHRSALEAVRAKYGDNWFTPVVHPKGKTGPTTFSEDLSFCVRLAGCDVPVWVDTAVTTSHDKGGVFLDEHTFDQQRAADSAIAAQGSEQ